MKKLNYLVHNPLDHNTSPQKVVFLLHGYGANAADLIPIAYSWSPHTANTIFISLNAPRPLSDKQDSFAWFDISDLDPERIQIEIKSSIKPTLDTLHHIWDKYSISPEQTLLVGFSQGASMALYLALYHIAVKGVVAYSGFLIAPETPQFSPSVCLVHGDQDHLIPLSELKKTQDTLKKYRIPFESWISEGLGHGMSPFGLEKGRVFLEQVMA